MGGPLGFCCLEDSLRVTYQAEKIIKKPFNGEHAKGDRRPCGHAIERGG